MRIRAAATLALLMALASGCGDPGGGPKGPGELTEAEANAIAAKQLGAFGTAKPPGADEDADRRLKFAIIGRWEMKDVPPTHYRKTGETSVAKVDAPHAGLYLDFRDNATVRGTEVGTDQAADGKRQLAVHDTDFEGTWDIRSGVLSITTRGSNHTSTQLQRVAFEGDALVLRHWEDATFPVKVYVRPARSSAPSP